MKDKDQRKVSQAAKIFQDEISDMLFCNKD
jgi:hypothetical protein